VSAGLDHSALELASLSPAAQKAAAPGPTRMMAAKGLAPLPRPADVTSVLYQIAITDPTLAASAVATATGLPDAIVLGAIKDPQIDARVLDWLGLRVGDRPPVFEALVLAPAVADATIAALAARGDAHQVDLIAQNEQRLLRHPEIIAALYKNARARMSTVDRAVELAVRNEVRVPGLACWAGLDELDETPLVTGDPDAIAPPDAERPEAGPEVDEKKVPIGKMTVSAKIRLATVGNAFARAVLIRDPLKMVAVAAIKSPGVSEIEAARYAGNAGLCDDVIRHIAARREWTKLYGVKLSLIMNPKTPMTDSTRMMPFLREKDLRNVIKSRGIPSAVVAQARKLLAQRNPNAGK
jgi:hypothetical protein